MPPRPDGHRHAWVQPSRVDLAVIASPEWDGRSELEDMVRTRLGNDCDVLVFTEAEFTRLARDGEPVVSDILHDGVPLVGGSRAL